MDTDLAAEAKTETKAEKKTSWYNRPHIWGLIAALPGLRGEAKSALNGVVGDRLERDDSSLRIPMVLLSGSGQRAHELDLDADLAAQLPHASSSITVFVHSLMSTERIWGYPGELKRFGQAKTYAERLAEDVATTTLYVRYNTGRHISSNGRDLAKMLERLVDAWPVEVKEVNLVGYSMGGLVARSAGHYGHQSKANWVALLNRMYLLGTPLRGAPLEQFAHIVTYVLHHVPTPITRIIAALINQRSDGIKDLRHGYLIDEDWQNRHPDAISLGRPNKLALIPHVHHYIIAGNLFADEHHPAAKVLGDILVTPFSAKDEGIDGSLTERSGRASRVFPGLNHLDLANHDDVYAQMLEWWKN